MAKYVVLFVHTNKPESYYSASSNMKHKKIYKDTWGYTVAISYCDVNCFIVCLSLTTLSADHSRNKFKYID